MPEVPIIPEPPIDEAEPQQFAWFISARQEDDAAVLAPAPPVAPVDDGEQPLTALGLRAITDPDLESSAAPVAAPIVPFFDWDALLDPAARRDVQPYPDTESDQ
jgi:hypothetical protein